MIKSKSKKILIASLLLFFSLLTPIHAAKIEKGDYILEKDAIVEDNLYVMGENITINGVVDGDVVAIGQKVLLSGTISGDLYLLGTTVTVDGYIYGNIFTLGSNVSITSTVEGNTYAGGIVTNINGNITNDLFILAGSSKLEGNVGDDVRAFVGQLVSTAQVGGDFLAMTDNYSIDPNDIQGQFDTSIFTNGKDIVEKFTFSKEDFIGFNLGLIIINFLGMYIVGTLLIVSAPVKTLQIEKKIISSWTEFLKSYITGMIILFAIPIPIVLLLITFVGIPLAVLLIGIMTFLSLFGIIWAESAIGQKVLQLTKGKDTWRFFSLLIGRGISTVVKLIPLIRGFYSISLIALTVGAVLRTKYDAFSGTVQYSKKGKTVVKKKTTKREAKLPF